MFTLKEIIHADIEPSALDPKKLESQERLLAKLNIIRERWGKSMIVTSGIRTWAKHTQIYKDKAEKKQPPFADGVYDESKIPSKSSHLETVVDVAAADIADPDLAATEWLQNTPEGQQAMEDADVFCESGNKNWLHVQDKPFASYKPGGTRWFKP